MSSTTPVTSKNTKAEILEAYEQMRTEFEAMQTQQPAPAVIAVKKKEEEKIVEKTKDTTSGNIEQGVSHLRRQINIELDTLLHTLSFEAKKLEDIRSAIAIERERLEHIRNISLADDALQTLIAQFDQKKKELEAHHQDMMSTLDQEMAAKRRAWHREQEEYKYTLERTRREEEDQYQQSLRDKRLAMEEDMRVREATLAAKEKEMIEKEGEMQKLKHAAEQFPIEQQQSIETAVSQAKESMKKEFETERRIREQEWKGEKQMLETRVENLQETIRQYAEEVASLKQALSQANRHSQSLAATVIESVSGRRMAPEEEKKEKEG